jgi:Ca-activated chloride channel family protein
VAWNLELAVQKQKKKEEQQKQDQEKQDQEKQDQEKQDQEKQDQQKQDQQKQDQQASQPKSRQEMEQMLDALDRDQQSLAQQQARRRAVAMPAAPMKDW